jgi:transposase
VLWERSVVEQRYDAVREVLGGRSLTEVAARYGVSRQSVHTWMGRYRAGGLAGLQDRSHRPTNSPDKTSAEVEAALCQLRRTHPGWGPQRLGYELGRRRVEPPPSRVTIWRILARNGLVDPSLDADAATIGPGSARRRCRCGRWTSWVGSGWRTASSASWSPGSTTTPAIAWWPTWCFKRLAGRCARRWWTACGPGGCPERS